VIRRPRGGGREPDLQGPPRAARPILLGASLTLAMSAGILLQVVFGALGPFLVADLTISRSELGALTTALYLTGALLSPIGGRMVDRFDPRRVLDLLFALAVLTALGVALAPSYEVLVALALAGGVGVAVANPVTNQVVATAASPNRQGLVTGVKQSGVQAWIFVGGAALPALAALWGWRTAVLGAAAVPAAGYAVRVLSHPPGPSSRPSPRSSPSRRKDLPAAARWLAPYGFFIGCGSSALGAYLPLFAVERLDEPSVRAGLLTAVIGGLGVIVRIAWGWRADRVSTPVAQSLGGMALGAVMATILIVLAERWGVALAWAGAALAGISATAWNSIGMLAIVRSARDELRGRASAAVVGAFYWGFVIGPLSFGALVDSTESYAWGWLFVGSAFASAALIATVWSLRPGHTSM
jgi:predicted MFS family arabinose efflux permease